MLLAARNQCFLKVQKNTFLKFEQFLYSVAALNLSYEISVEWNNDDRPIGQSSSKTFENQHFEKVQKPLLEAEQFPA